MINVIMSLDKFQVFFTLPRLISIIINTTVNIKKIHKKYNLKTNYKMIYKKKTFIWQPFYNHQIRFDVAE